MAFTYDRPAAGAYPACPAPRRSGGISMRRSRCIVHVASVLLVASASIATSTPAFAQFFSDRAPPVPPAAVPDTPVAPVLNLAPPSDSAAPSAAPTAPSPLGVPQSVTAPLNSIPPVVAGLPPSNSGQGVLALSAKFGKDLGPVTNGVIWRVYSDKPDQTGAFKLIREDHTATPNIVLPPGNYVVYASLGLVSEARPVTVKQDTSREAFELPAGGLRIEGRVGSSRIPTGQVSFNIYKGSQFDTSTSERAPIAQNVPTGDIALLPEGMYNIVSTYGDANSVVRSDIRVTAGKLTDVVVTHRAAVITLKLVSEKGGEALANTAWSVLTPAGDVINESLGAFPRVVLAEGDYRVIAKNEGHVFERSLNVVNGVDGEVEVLAK